MRRTRHLVLPVRSWQYVGLMLVSLACLTLGLVSRDREGKSGSLTSPELLHSAPHEVDSCPNVKAFETGDMFVDDLKHEMWSDSDKITAGGVRSGDSRVRSDRRSISRGNERQRELRTRLNDRRSVSVDRRAPDAARTRLESFRRDVRASRSRDTEQRVQDRRRERSVERISRDRRARIISDAGRRSQSVSDIQRRSRSALDVERRSRSTIDAERRSRSVSRAERRQEPVQNERNQRSRLQDSRRDSLERSAAVERSRRINERSTNERNNRRIISELRRTPDSFSRVERFRSKPYNNYLISDKLMNSLKTQDYQFLKHGFIVILCTIYTASIFKRKTGLFSGNYLPRFLVW